MFDQKGNRCSTLLLKRDINSNANTAASKKLYITNTGKHSELSSARE